VGGVIVGQQPDNTFYYNLAYYLRQGGYVFTLFVCLLAGLRTNYSADFTKFGVNMAHTEIWVTIC